MKNILKTIALTAISVTVLCASAVAVSSTPQTAITVSPDEKTFTVALQISEAQAFAGAEFTLQPQTDMTLQQVHYDSKLAGISTQKSGDGTVFGFYTTENNFSGDYTIKATYSYNGITPVTLHWTGVDIVRIQDKQTETDVQNPNVTFTVTRTTATSSNTTDSSKHNTTARPNQSPTADEATQVIINPFRDVTSRNWYYDAVLYASQNGIMKGVGDGVFAPQTNVTRGMMAQILYNMAAQPSVRATSIFADIAPTAWYANAVTWANSSGIVTGMTATTYSPALAITREQVATILYRYAKENGVNMSKTTTLHHFADQHAVSAYAKTPIGWAVANGIISGRDNAMLAPKSTATRAEIATILQRFLVQCNATSNSSSGME